MLQVQAVVALLCVLLLLLALSMLVYRALVLAISMLVPLLHAAPTIPRTRSTLIPPRTTTPAAVGYPRSAPPTLASPSGLRQGQRQRHARGGSRPHTVQLREQPNNRSSEGEPPYVGELHRPVDAP